MRRFLAPLLLGLALAACGADDQPIAIRTTGDPTTTTTPATTVTTESPVTTTTPVTTVTTEPVVTTIEPGSADDPWGPILCPSVRHPAHHRPCPVPNTATATTRPASSVSAPAAANPAPSVNHAPAANLASIVECEDNDNPAAGPTGYQSNTGNGYYGGGQWLPSTFRVALGQALAQGRIDQATYDANIGTRPDLVAPWVQDAAMAAHIAAGYRNAWPNC